MKCGKNKPSRLIRKAIVRRENFLYGVSVNLQSHWSGAIMKNKMTKSVGVMIAAMMWLDVGQAQAQTIPGGRPEDATMAATKPDEYAWQLFLALNRQAL